MGLLSWILFGGLAGWIASKFTGRDRRRGFIKNVIVGVIGSSIGGYLGELLGFDGSIDRFSVRNLIVAVIGSVILLGVLNLFSRKK